jgi:hypothetical protein
MTFANLRAPSGHRLCRHLRCKEMYYTDAAAIERARQDPEHAFDGKLFWCLKTSRSWGPDGTTCGAEECPPNRECYEA